VTHCDLAIYMKKYIKAKEEEIWKLKYNFTMQKYISLEKNPLKKKTKILQDIRTLVTNLKFQHKSKYHLSKILI
jgi:2-polyprenyl-3-methyl-5-hydroxy-6-metoxy-1,4-benzoquinol methylase